MAKCFCPTCKGGKLKVLDTNGNRLFTCPLCKGKGVVPLKKTTTKIKHLTPMYMGELFKKAN